MSKIQLLSKPYFYNVDNTEAKRQSILASKEDNDTLYADADTSEWI